LNTAFALNQLQHDGTGPIIDSRVQRCRIIESHVDEAFRQRRERGAVLGLPGCRCGRQRPAMERLRGGDNFARGWPFWKK
jgi:hypothetical protein